MSNPQIKTVEIAREFSKLLLTEIGANKLAIAVAENAADMTKGDDSTCASHNFCDSNMVMEESFIKVIGHGPRFIEDAPEAEQNADLDLWKTAWTMAKHAGFNPDKIN